MSREDESLKQPFLPRAGWLCGWRWSLGFVKEPYLSEFAVKARGYAELAASCPDYALRRFLSGQPDKLVFRCVEQDCKFASRLLYKPCVLMLNLEKGDNRVESDGAAQMGFNQACGRRRRHISLTLAIIFISRRQNQSVASHPAIRRFKLQSYYPRPLMSCLYFNGNFINGLIISLRWLAFYENGSEPIEV